MRLGGSKQKGADFERHVCKILSLWVTHGERDDCFWRSSISGGRATIRKKIGDSTAAQAGDISAIAEEAHPFLSVFFVECKHVQNLCIKSALISGTGDLAHFWTKLREQAFKHDRKPLLIAKENRGPILVFLQKPDDAVFFGIGHGELGMLKMCGNMAAYTIETLLDREYQRSRFTQ